MKKQIKVNVTKSTFNNKYIAENYMEFQFKLYPNPSVLKEVILLMLRQKSKIPFRNVGKR